jgi:hypothetical protein
MPPAVIYSCLQCSCLGAWQATTDLKQGSRRRSIQMQGSMLTICNELGQILARCPVPSDEHVYQVAAVLSLFGLHPQDWKCHPKLKTATAEQWRCFEWIHSQVCLLTSTPTCLVSLLNKRRCALCNNCDSPFHWQCLYGMQVAPGGPVQGFPLLHATDNYLTDKNLGDHYSEPVLRELLRRQTLNAVRQPLRVPSVQVEHLAPPRTGTRLVRGPLVDASVCHLHDLTLVAAVRAGPAKEAHRFKPDLLRTVAPIMVQDLFHWRKRPEEQLDKYAISCCAALFVVHGCVLWCRFRQSNAQLRMNQS